ACSREYNVVATRTVLFRHFQPSLRGNSVVPAFPTLGLREHRCSATCFAGFEETTLFRCLVHWICANRVVSTIVTLDLREQNCWGVCKVGSARTALFQRLQWRIRENRIVPPKLASGRLEIGIPQVEVDEVLWFSLVAPQFASLEPNGINVLRIFSLKGCVGVG